MTLRPFAQVLAHLAEREPDRFAALLANEHAPASEESLPVAHLLVEHEIRRGCTARQWRWHLEDITFDPDLYPTPTFYARIVTPDGRGLPRGVCAPAAAHAFALAYLAALEGDRG